MKLTDFIKSASANNALIAENQQKVFEAQQKVFEAGVAQGRDDYYNTMWDGIQKGGTRNDYTCFADGLKNNGWFKPKYDIRPITADRFMRNFGIESNDFSSRLDLVKLLDECNVVLDFSKCTLFTYLFYQARISHLPEIDLTGVTKANQTDTLMFGGFVTTIDKFIVKEISLMRQTFGYAASLENIVFDGVIGNRLDMKDCPKLTVESAKSAILHLKDYSGTEYEYAHTISFHENVWILLNAEGNASPTGTTWEEYVTSLGWNT